jgi:hypothetical protein
VVVIARTGGPAPSLKADAEAKRFTPDPTALTLYFVCRNWGDGRKFAKVQAELFWLCVVTYQPR